MFLGKMMLFKEKNNQFFKDIRTKIVDFERIILLGLSELELLLESFQLSNKLMNFKIYFLQCLPREKSRILNIFVKDTETNGRA